MVPVTTWALLGQADTWGSSCGPFPGEFGPSYPSEQCDDFCLSQCCTGTNQCSLQGTGWKLLLCPRVPRESLGDIPVVSPAVGRQAFHPTGELSQGHPG